MDISKNMSQNPSIFDLVSLKGSKAFITGGAQGIGLATAHRFAEAGASVIIGDKNSDGALLASKEISNIYGVKSFGLELNVSDSNSVSNFADKGINKIGGMDIWVNNAGVYPGKTLVETDDDFWDCVQDVNLKGTFYGCREAAKRMISLKSQQSRSIINVASVSGTRGRSGLTHYSAAKSGVIGLTRGVAVELAPHGIRVLCVVPALAETPGSQAMRASANNNDTSGNALKNMENKIMASFPMGRIGQSDEIARVILFSASNLASFMTGSNIFVDGGLTAT